MKKTKLLQLAAGILMLGCIAINAKSQISNTISPAEKVYGLSKFWKEASDNFVYLDKLTPGSWDSAYKALIPQVIATHNDYDYYRLLQKFCALLKDGHTEISMPNIKGLSFMFNTFGDDLLVLKRVDNKVIIKRTFKKNLNKFPLGSEIVEVNGLPTDKFIEDSIAPYISSSTDKVRKELASGMLLMGAPGSVFNVRVKKPDGQMASYSLTHARATDSVFAPSPGDYPDEQNREAFEFKTLPDNIAYVGLHTFASGSGVDSLFETVLPSLQKSKAIVIDLRYNGGGDDGMAFNILQHFIKDTVFLGASSTYRTINPYLKAIGRYVNIADTVGNTRDREAWLLYHGYPVFEEPHTGHYKIAENIKRLSVPVAILTSSNTESAAEDFLIGASNQPHITRIGETSNGSTGMPYSFDLPGGGHARICIKKDMYPDGKEFVGYGIQPDIKVVPAVKDYLENKDVVLDAALKYLGSKH